MFWTSFLKNQLRGRGYHIYTGREFQHWVGKGGRKHEGMRVRTGLKQKEARIYKAKAIDDTIERILSSGKFTEDCMLVVRNPYLLAPLTALIVFVTDRPCSVRVVLGDGMILDETTEAVTRHRIPVYGLYAGRINSIYLELRTDEGVWKKKNILIPTEKLPPFFENQIIKKKSKGESAIPFTIVWGGNTKHPYAFDQRGNIRYYLKLQTKTFGLFPLSQGRLLYLSPNICIPTFSNPHVVHAMELDLMGRVYREYMIMDGMHHDACEMEPGGNILTLSSSLDEFVEDAVIEIDRQTGRVVKKLNLATILSDHPYFDFFDWAHLNTVSYQPEEHTILLCARNLHSVIKIDWETDELQWILCDDQFWKGTPYEEKVLKLAEGTPSCYQAHAAYFLPGEKTEKKRLIIYDNHWHKRRPVENFDEDPKSHVRIYEIDERAKTVALEQDYPTTKSKIRSNGLVIGKRTFAMSGELVKEIEECQGRITEFSSKSGKIVNDYLTKTGFYRAYPFMADFAELCKPVREMPKLISFDRDPAEECPESIFPDRIELRQQEMEFKLYFYEDFLMVYGMDHEMEKIYFRGARRSYVKDFSNTDQRMPAGFADATYAIPVSTTHLEPDIYNIYIQWKGSLYDMGESFQIIR